MNKGSSVSVVLFQRAAVNEYDLYDGVEVKSLTLVSYLTHIVQLSQMMV